MRLPSHASLAPSTNARSGRSAPPGKRMGHAGAIIGGKDDTAGAKIDALRKCGVAIAASPATIGETMAKALKIG